MISLKCKNCGGEMSIDVKGELACPYCGTKAHLSDLEFSQYKNFRLNMLHYLRAAADANADKSDGTFLWEFCESATFYGRDDTAITVNYLFYNEEDGVQTYVAKESVIYVFPPHQTHRADGVLRGVGMLQYPSADIKNLGIYFPAVKARIDLKDGGVLLAVAKPENVYPLYAFGSIKPEHTAWIISRMENFCCLFEFSGITQDGISLNSVYINPRTHEAYLFGGWWNARRKLSAGDRTDLYALRSTAQQVLGEYKSAAPKQLLDFLKGRPAEDAYADFSLWDRVIEEGFGGHKFVKF